jgi:type I restriction enzyme S subunit
MEVKPGYKQTEVGAVPNEWDVKPLGEIGEVRMCKRVLKQQTHDHGEVPFYKIGTFGGVADAFIPRHLFEEFRRRYSFPKKGDILISAAGTIGRTVVYDGTPAYFQDSNIVWVENDEKKATNAYLRYRYQVTKWSVSHGGTVARLYNDSLRTKIHVPIPSLSEQRAIAQALSDVDALLDGLDRLIAKKRDLKQAAMQQLLTGQTRLPGFHGEWEVKRLENLCDLRVGRTPPRLNPALWGEGYVWLSIADIQSKFVASSKEQVTMAAAATMELIQSGTLLMSFKLSIGRLCFAGCDLFTNEAICSFNNLKANAEYLYYALSRVDFSLYGKQAVKGYTLNKESLKTVKVTVPASAEQAAIAKMLTEMDLELAGLEQRRQKTHALKRAMMQELLTGRTRLV